MTAASHGDRAVHAATGFAPGDGLAAHYREGWRLFRIHARVMVLAVAILFLSWVALEVAVVALQWLGPVVNVALHLLFLLVFSGLLVGVHRIALDAVDGVAPSLSSLDEALGRSGAALLALLIYAAISLAGFLLLIVPGIYFSVKFALLPQVLAARPASPGEAFREAALLAYGRWWAQYRFFLLAVVLNIAGAAVLGVGLAVSLPVTLLAAASRFRELQREPNVALAA